MLRPRWKNGRNRNGSPRTSRRRPEGQLIPRGVTHPIQQSLLPLDRRGRLENDVLVVLEVPEPAQSMKEVGTLPTFLLAVPLSACPLESEAEAKSNPVEEPRTGLGVSPFDERPLVLMRFTLGLRLAAERIAVVQRGKANRGQPKSPASKKHSLWNRDQ